MFVTGKPFWYSLLIASEAEACFWVKHLKVLYIRVGSWPYSQTTDKADKASQGHNISDEEKQFYESLILGFRVMKLFFEIYVML